MMVRKVVVKFTPLILEHQEKLVYAMCIQELGLTAYGKDPKEARAALENLFHSFITGHRGQDTLEEVLDLSGLEWSWEDQYKDELPYTYAKPTSRDDDAPVRPSGRTGPLSVPSGKATPYVSSFAPVSEGLGLAA